MSSSPQPGNIRLTRAKRVAFDDTRPMLPRLEDPHDDNEDNDTWEDVDSPTTEGFREEYFVESPNTLYPPPASRLPGPSSRAVRRRKAVNNGVYQYNRPIYVATPSNTVPAYAYKGRERVDSRTSTSITMGRNRTAASQHYSSEAEYCYHEERRRHGDFQEPTWQEQTTGFLFSWTGGLLRNTLGRIMVPLSWLLVAYLCVFVVIRAAVPMLKIAVSPLCQFPIFRPTGLCSTNIPTSSGSSPNTPKWADYPALVSMQNPTFEKLLESSTDSSAIALDIKKTEMATADLANLVDMSELTSKRLLAEALREFLHDAKSTGRQLHKLHSQVGGAVDEIMAVNEYALRAIEGAAKRDSLESSFSKALKVISLSPSHGGTPDGLIIDRFIDSMNVMQKTLSTLIQAFEGTLLSLQSLETRLATIEKIIARENIDLREAHGDLLAELWTILGGNRKKRQHFENHLELLSEIRDYRKRALVHVGGALQTLLGMSEDVEVLRQKVASSPDVVGPGGNERGIPIEVHVASIQNGLKRLEEGRKSARRREEDMIGRLFGNVDEVARSGRSGPQVQRIN